MTYRDPVHLQEEPLERLPDDFTVGFEVRYGQAALTFRSAGQEHTFSATNLTSTAIERLIQAIVDHHNGRAIASFSWESEPGGVIIDLANVGHGASAVVVQKMGMPEWFGGPTAEKPWAPTRGDVLFMTVQATQVIDSALIDMVNGLRESVTDTGEIPSWGSRFPSDLWRTVSQ